MSKTDYCSCFTSDLVRVTCLAWCTLMLMSDSNVVNGRQFRRQFPDSQSAFEASGVLPQSGGILPPPVAAPPAPTAQLGESVFQFPSLPPANDFAAAMQPPLPAAAAAEALPPALPVGAPPPQPPMLPVPPPQPGDMSLAALQPGAFPAGPPPPQPELPSSNKDSESIVGFAPPLGIALKGLGNQSKSLYESDNDEFKHSHGGWSIGMVVAIVIVLVACLIGVIVICVNLRKKSSVKKSAAKGFKKGVSKTKKEHKKRREQKKYIKSLVHKAVKSSSQDRSSHHGSTEGKSGMSTSRSRKSDSEATSLIEKKK